MSQTIVVKINYNDTTRRFQAPCDSFDAFYASVVSTLSVKNVVRLSYVDEDGDMVVFDSTSELHEAIAHGVNSNNVLRVHLTDAAVAEPVQIAADAEAAAIDMSTGLVDGVVDKKQEKFHLKALKNQHKQMVKEGKKLVKEEKQALKSLKQEVKLAKKLDKKEGKLCGKMQLKQAMQPHWSAVREAQETRAEAAQLVKALRAQLKSDNLADRGAVAAQLTAAVSELRAATDAVQAAKAAAKACRDAVKGELKAAWRSQDQSAPQATSVAVPLKRLVIAKQRFAQNGLHVAFITPELMDKLKAEGPPALVNHRKELVNKGFVVLPPMFVKRLRALNDQAMIEKMVDNKSKHLLAKGKGQVNDEELLEIRKSIEAKHAEVKKAQDELRALKKQFKTSIVVGTTATENVVVGNTPVC